MPSRLADRLSAGRHENFVGRARERALFHAAISAASLPFNVLFVYGSGGIGKTTLLREFAEISKQASPTSTWTPATLTRPPPPSWRPCSMPWRSRSRGRRSNF